MAYYAALVSVVQLLKDITHHYRHPNFLLDKHQFHFSLYEKFNLLLEMVDDYSPKVDEEESNDILERRIRDAAYRAQDIIESRISTTLSAHIHLEKRTSGAERLRRHFDSTFGKALEKFEEKKYYRDLQKVKAEVDSIVEDLTKIKVESNKVHEDLQPSSYISEVEAPRVQATSGNNMLVFDEEFMNTIKAQLCGQPSKLEVISIAGMGGLGKTTLARNILDDRLIRDHFECHAWVTVSQDYCLKNIIAAIVKSLNMKKEKLELGERELDGDGKKEFDGDDIYKYLFGRKYLIVIDDVWHARFWDDIKRIFPDNLNRSRILITTRLYDVAAYVSSSRFLHQMQFLDENQSWILLREKVFAAQEHFPKELEITGKLIAKNCGGLPLTIVVIAGVLSNVKRAQLDWENIARKVSSTAIDQRDDLLSAVLSMSYNHLSHHLKPCFLYLGGYPEDHEIRISELIRLWVAEGFLKPIESKSLEEVGEEYLKDLVNRNLVLITQKKSNGKFKFCIIHDVLRDLCSQRARDENFLLYVQRNDDFQRVPIRNVSCVYVQTLNEYSKIHKYKNKQGSHVRSLIYCTCSPEFRFDDDSLLVACYKLLRLLYIEARGIRYIDSDEILRLFHSKITELLHLRYLNLMLGSTPHFPASSIFHLQNLQTLIFGSYVWLPSEIWKMSQLRHVICKRGVAFPPIPYDEVRIIDGVPLLGSLQTLSTIGPFSFTRDTIEMIPNLKKLVFKYETGGDHVWEVYGLNNLVHLHQLETLYIGFDLPIWQKIVLLPENFAFSSTLIKLTLSGCKLPWKDMSVVGLLPNLQVLKLRSNAFVGEEWEPIEGQFLRLKFLEMFMLMDLKYWRAENTHFPLLEHLHISFCLLFEEIPPGIGDIPTLQLIKLGLQYYSNPALESSALEIEEQQRELGNDDLQVHVDLYW